MFWLIALSMLALALGLVLPPLLRRPAADLDHNAVNIAIHRQRLAELEAEEAAGTVAADTAGEARREIERQLLSELQPQRRRLVKPARWAAGAVALLLPALALGLHQRWGTPLADAQVLMADPAQLGPNEMQQAVAALERQLQRRPDNAGAWSMLAQNYAMLDRPEAAVAAMRELVALRPGDAQVLTELAQLLGMQRADRSLQGEPRRLLAQALEQDPDHPDALWLAGLAAAERGDLPTAEGHWGRLLAVLPAGDEARQVRQALRELRSARGE